MNETTRILLESGQEKSERIFSILPKLHDGRRMTAWMVSKSHRMGEQPAATAVNTKDMSGGSGGRAV